MVGLQEQIKSLEYNIEKYKTSASRWKTATLIGVPLGIAAGTVLGIFLGVKYMK
ncbi:MAG: hypothetical protein HUJ68_04560 [Clostridia bacterium]|nr:hypothetical protein [Clostridia bacterium]